MARLDAFLKVVVEQSASDLHLSSGAPAAIRKDGDLVPLPFGKGEVRREGRGIAILAFGTLLYPALEAAERLDATVVNMRWAKPLDVALLLQVAAQHEAIVTVEEGAIMGGAGSAVAEALNAAGVARALLQLGLRDEFIEHGDPARLLSMQGLDAAGIEASIRARFNLPDGQARPVLKVVQS